MVFPGHRLSAQVRRLSQWSVVELSRTFPELAEPLSKLKVAGRERLFPPLVTFWMFLSQVLSEGASCQEMVARALACLRIVEGRKASAGNSAYCQARKRLPESMLEQLAESTSAQLERQVQDSDLWLGRRVRIMDGSSVSMPDTPRNQKTYPQPEGQKPGCGSPVLRLVVIFSLATGAILKLARGTLSQSERSLFQSLRTLLRPGDVLLADRGFCSFAEIHLLIEQGVDAVLRNHQRRSVGVRSIQKLAPGDRLVEWLQSLKDCPAWMPLKSWKRMPGTLSLREITYTVSVRGFRSKKITVVTTLTDAERFPMKAFIDLYRCRWNAELFLRDVKISLHMDVLRCKTPYMIHKELWMHLIAYNLIRSMIWAAGQKHGVSIHSISFKSSLALIRQWAPWMASLDPCGSEAVKMHSDLLHYLVQQRLPYRPNRLEPRARKRRPKNYPLLTAPRRKYKEIIHRNRYSAEPNARARRAPASLN
jgi:hypothetical protein